MLLVCYNLLNSQSLPINKQQRKMVGRKESNNWPMVSFVHNGKKILTMIRHSFKTTSTKFRATFLRQ